MGKLFAKYKVYHEVPGSGDYIAKITDINQYHNTLIVDFIPYEDKKGKLIRYAPVCLRITDNNKFYSAAANFIELFEEFESFDEIVGYVVGITIKDKEKDGVIYHNIVDVYGLEDEEVESTDKVEEVQASESDLEEAEQPLEAEEVEEAEEDYTEVEEDEF